MVFSQALMTYVDELIEGMVKDGAVIRTWEGGEGVRELERAPPNEANSVAAVAADAAGSSQASPKYVVDKKDEKNDDHTSDNHEARPPPAKRQVLISDFSAAE